MQAFKINHYQNDHPGRSFPWFKPLSAAEATALRSRLASKAGLSPDVDPLSLVKRLGALSAGVSEANAEADGFDLAAVVRAQGIAPQTDVFVNWYRFDDVDQMRFRELAEHFDDIWYPSADDIDIFDASLSWILSVRHDGIIDVVRFQ